MVDYTFLVTTSILLSILISTVHLTLLIRKILNGFVRKIVREELEPLKIQIKELKQLIEDENRNHK